MDEPRKPVWVVWYKDATHGPYMHLVTQNPVEAIACSKSELLECSPMRYLPAESVREVLEAANRVLIGLRQWDMMDAAADGQYWRGKIEPVIRLIEAALKEQGRHE